MIDDNSPACQFPACQQTRVVVRGGQGGGEEMPGGMLSMRPLRPSPHGDPGPISVSPSVKAALPGLGPEKAARVRAVVARKKW